MGELIQVEIAYAEPKAQFLAAMELAPGSTAADAIDVAIDAGLIPSRAAGLDAGIWGRLVDRSARLKAGDRVELYRPLHEDPREARRRHAAEGRTMASGDVTAVSRHT